MTTEKEPAVSKGKIALEIIQKIQCRASELENTHGVHSCIFRGEAQDSWGEGKDNKKVSSSLYRMLARNLQEKDADPDPMPEDMRPFEKSIVEKAKKHIGKSALTIEVLSELQHYGGKTNLIDFTKDLHVALFFACSASPKENGRIILLPLDPDKIKQDIAYPQNDDSRALSTASIEKILGNMHSQKDDSGIKNPDYSETGYALVEPTGKNPRPIFQSSIFIHPLKGYLNENIIKTNSISIKNDDKNAILRYLDKYHNINSDTIYNDIHGYIQNQENNKNMQFFFGRNAHVRKKYKKAIADYDKAIEIDPQFAEAYFYRGHAVVLAETPKDAIKDFDRTIELDPQFVWAYIHRGYAYTTETDYEKAIADYDKAIEIDSQFAEVYFLRGHSFTMKEEYENAISDFNKAIELNPQLADAYLSRGSAYANIGAPEKAIIDYNKTIELNPQLPRAYFNRGLAYAMKKEREKAIKNFNKAIELNPQLAETYLSRGAAYANIGAPEKAITDYTKAIELNPQLPGAYFNRGLAYTIKGGSEKAITDFTKAIELNPKYAEAYFHRGRAYATKKEYEEAITDFTKAIELNPKYADAHLYRGIVYANTGTPEKAITDYTKAIEINPQYTDAYIHRAQLHFAKEDHKEALADAKRAQTLYQEESNNEGIQLADALIQQIKDASPDLA